MKLALGTVQFGLDYGVSNTKGQVNKSQVKDILAEAAYMGINTLDCAGAYGNSEQILGELNASKELNIISKVPALSPQQDSIMPFAKQSLYDLKCKRLSALLFHQAENLLVHTHKEEFYLQLKYLKKQHIVESIGVSVYAPEQLIQITQAYDIDIAQVPINVFDQRFISPQILTLCQQKKIRLHARSLFLQGLLLMEEGQRQVYFKPYEDKFKAFSDLANYLSCSKITLALSVLLARDSLNQIKKNAIDIIEKIVVGVCSTQQLAEIVNAYHQAKLLQVSPKELCSLADSRIGLINPSHWQIEG
jgi:aryl-alcohol dehydrogenase-like predicted oxidoreductase